MYMQIWAERHLRLVIIYQQHADCRRKQNEMLFLDDSPANVSAAIRSGMQSVCCPQGADLGKLLKEALA